jgi:hypothetical protein
MAHVCKELRFGTTRCLGPFRQYARLLGSFLELLCSLYYLLLKRLLISFNLPAIFPQPVEHDVKGMSEIVDLLV